MLQKLQKLRTLQTLRNLQKPWKLRKLCRRRLTQGVGNVLGSKLCLLRLVGRVVARR